MIILYYSINLASWHQSRVNFAGSSAKKEPAVFLVTVIRDEHGRSISKELPINRSFLGVIRGFVARWTGRKEVRRWVGM